MTEWRYYNHALIPVGAPHEETDVSELEGLWKKDWDGIPFFARYTTDFDCGYETNWWYVIKDELFDIATLKAKRRYEINKGKKNFEVKLISPMDYSEDLFNVQVKAYSAYPEKYRPTANKQEFMEDLGHWGKYVVYGAFEKESHQLCGYALLRDWETYLEFSVLKTIPEYEHLAVNAAMVAKIVEDYNGRMNKGFYICDGERAVVHETAFQDYLEKYFGFRKAYCKLHMCYRKPYNIAVKMLYPFRKAIHMKNRLGILINAVLRMEEICRNQGK